MTTILKIISFNIRKERIKQGLTQELLAEKAGLHPNYIGLLERQQRNVSILSLEKIAKVLNISVIDLLKYKG